ncbi:hypothetical protein PHMEG_00018175 [Phytophthora megakarya]|uniref:Uncharacterized protein n=1 Tax=Phytophthora megakarya TaxID=4795 RepID=A0A225VUY5_9STRA|nr:hypothetical protein PHMEG_00018175 [Phytophthora megakarya]
MHKSKTNQEGNGSKDPRHLYANPLSPETCWITALALFLACRTRHLYANPLSPETCWITALALFLACRPTQPPGPLFPGSEQKARFGNILRKIIAELKHQTHYGTLYIRKGVATFACSGSTGGPSIASVCLRVGWSLGGVQDRYIRYEAEPTICPMNKCAKDFRIGQT